RRLPFVGLEAIGFIDLNPWKLLTKARQFVAVPRKLLLRLEQLESRAEPLLTGPGRVFRHHSCLLHRGMVSVPVTNRGGDDVAGLQWTSRVPRRRSASQRGRDVLAGRTITTTTPDGVSARLLAARSRLDPAARSSSANR